MPNSSNSCGSDSNEPAPRTYAPPSPHKGNYGSPSIAEFYDDAEFVEFLKQISIFVQAEDTPQKTVSSRGDAATMRNYLHRNLKDLREFYKDFKSQRTQRVQPTASKPVTGHHVRNASATER